MRDIFSDLYDKVLSFFNAQTQDDTKVVAKNRLKTVLMQDRVGFSERAMQMLKDDMLESISRYLEINVDSFDLSIDAADNATVLHLSIPVLRTRTDEEIDEALTIAEKVKIEKTEEIVGEIKELVKEKAQALADQITEQKEEDVQIKQEAETVEKEESEEEPKEEPKAKEAKEKSKKQIKETK